jgi:hypothetical protein
VLGTYGSTTASGWTTIGPSNGTLPSGMFTNIIYVSDSMGSDSRDGSTPTFIDDGNTEQFELSTAQNVFLNDVYAAPNGTHFTVAVTNSFAISGADVTLVQMKNRTGTPDASGTLTCFGSCTGPMTMGYNSAVPGIHGPVKTLIKAIGGAGPGVYDPDDTKPFGLLNGDGTGLGTKGNWRTAGSIASSFALRSGAPDWVLLRMGDTWVGQALETAFTGGIGGNTDNFGKRGFSEQEPMVISAYDEDVPVTSPNLPSGMRARPIIEVPSATAAYAAMQGAGHYAEFANRAGIQPQGAGGAGDYLVIMGIDFYAAQRNPTDPAYVLEANVADNTAVNIRGGQVGILIEDSRARWFWNGFIFTNGGAGSTADVNVRRNQVDHCWGTLPAENHTIGMAIDDIVAVGGAISPGFNFEENVGDLCGWFGANFAFGDDLSRNFYIQWNSVFGNRRGNTSTRSGSEDFQFRSGGIITDNFTFEGSYGFDVGHPEGFPALTSSTVVTNNVIQAPVSPEGKSPVGINFYNNDNISPTGNIIYNADMTISTSYKYAATDAYSGTIWLYNLANPGTGGTPGSYSISAGGPGCFGGSNFTGGTGTSPSPFAITVGGGGSITSLQFVEPGANDTYEDGQLLTPVANNPSLSTTGVSFTAVGTGGTLGDYGTNFGAPFFGHCPRNPAIPQIGDASFGVALTNFSGSMAGSGALATFMINSFTGMTRALNGGTGFYDVTGTLTNGTTILGNADRPIVGDTITVTGVTPSAYNGTWTLTSVIDAVTWVWSLGTAVDPGPVTVQGKANAIQIISTGLSYQVGDILTAASTDVGGQTGIRIRVNSVGNLSGWTVNVGRIFSNGVHNLDFGGNIIFNWWDLSQSPPNPATDEGGVNDSPGGVHGSGAANIWTPIVACTGAQFTGVITAPNNLATSGLINGPIAIGQNLTGPGVTASTTITGGSGTSWTVSPNQTASSTTMYSYTCSPTTVYTAPYRTVQTYAGSLGLTATIDGYMNAALANAKWNWNPALTANNGLNPYIRLGFQ